MYHKPPEQFIGQGRYGAESIQAAAIEEQLQNARENPLAAAAAAVAASNGTSASGEQTNAENLLDIDFDGAAPASVQEQPSNGLSGLEGLAGTPQRVASPASTSQPAAGNLDDLMGVFGNGNAAPSSSAFGGMSDSDIMNGFAALDMSGANQPPPAKTQMDGSKKTNEDLLSLF